MTDTDERSRFDEWWLGDDGPYSIRAEWADTPTDAAWMAWRAQGEEIKRLRNELHLASEWAAKVYAGQAEDAAKITRLHSEIELLHRMMLECEVGFGKLAADNRCLREALRQIAGVDAWDDGEQGYVDKARAALAQGGDK